jgi:hypothetical protein
MFSGVIWVLLAFRLTFTDSFKIEKRSNILVMKRPIFARFFLPSEVNFGTISEMNQIRVPDTLRRLYYKFLLHAKQCFWTC